MKIFNNLSTIGAVSALLLLPSCVEKLDRSDCKETAKCLPEGGSNGDGDTGGASTGGKGTGASDTGGTGGTEDTCTPACGGDSPVCDEDAGECVECLKTSDCTDALCDTEAQSCVGCLETDDCTDATASLCDANSCAPCVVDDDCSHIVDKELCEESICVECRSEADCEGNVCDPDTNTCTDVEAGKGLTCSDCQYDAECGPGRVCVEMTFSNPEEGVVGKFCLWEKDAVNVGAPGGTCGLNSQPYSLPKAATTVNGQDTTVCVPRTTCAAVLDHVDGVDCTIVGNNSACGAEGFNDALCLNNGSLEPKCTYPCGGSDDRDCSPGYSCVTDLNGKYCGF